MKTHEGPREELLGLAAELRQLRAEHLRAGVGSSTRRHLETRIHEVSYHLDRRLESLVDDEEDRAAWRHHAHGGPAPERPEAGATVEGAAVITGPPPDRPTGRRPWPR
ncbi:MAG TPA: hypothetical protein PKD59_10830 [Miltoncostaeaceae bacterium]|nr:hypothetical protein [Miltoncostaeaceae bacterium]